MNKNTLLKIIAWASVLICMGVIFAFSSQPSEDSAGLSTGVLSDILSVLMPGFKSLSTVEQQGILDIFHHGIRKLAHLGIYTVLGALTMATLTLYRLTTPRRILFALSICILYAASDEVHQAFVPGRGPGIGDVGIDTLGSAIGIFFVLICILFFRKIKFKRLINNTY